MPALLRPLASTTVALVLGIFLLEAVVQAGAFMLRVSGQELPRSWLGNGHRVLCLGDSNTYGLYLEREQAYPTQLEAIWNESGRSPTIEVLNLGFPGTNSSQVARDFSRYLETFSPDVLILMIGANDYWTLPVEPRESPGRSGIFDFARRHSRLYRLYYAIIKAEPAVELIRDDSTGQAAPGDSAVLRYGEEEFEMDFVTAERPPEGVEAQLAKHLLQFAASTREAGVALVLMTYPAERNPYGAVNGIIRRVAKVSTTPLVDLAETFSPLCPGWSCPNLLFPDYHPKAMGYRLVAETIAPQLEVLLEKR